MMFIGAFGGLSQSAMACNPIDPNYNACVYHNIILPQQQQNNGYNNSGYNRPAMN
ncbi:hypothetical protein [Kingella negevensis]|uniref:hypothetical protein n=2 Tax=Kingella negevensis TaxID=1522312 RepID=UPI000AD4678B|nr:hypothetical protein [Kingella negevensis]MDK4680751.1 hypothetical protein [Kingella negevensis]MDK4681526.1 hypothetical protein [Kingella negevensis]MDK4687821.1 hypothetical protein [Kingella negevensis]MDK4691913.1 hypothetical protein [Kingella negevensis]MDK4692934.1 hypothetical protein [Kingella negevensis]